MLLSDISSLRQSCDRCHSRKQRCMRYGNEPCRRCKDAGEECIYSPPLRSGRPKNKTTSEDARWKESASGGASSSTPSNTGKRAKVITPMNTPETLIASTTPCTPNLESGDSGTSSWIYTSATTASNTVPDILDESVDFWRFPSNNGDAHVHHHHPPIISDASCNTLINGMDEPWPDLLASEWQPDAANTSSAKGLSTPVEFLQSNISRKKIDRSTKNAIDPVLLLSEINLQLHKIQTPNDLQCRKWKSSLDCTIQTAQSFMQVLSKLAPERSDMPCKSPSYCRSHVSGRPTFFNVSEDFTLSDLDWSIRGLQEQSLYTPSVKGVDSIVVRLALICYTKTIRCYKTLTSMLTGILVWAETNPDDQPHFLPIRIGILEASVSPQLHIAMLVQLISHHLDELSEKIRRLATLMIENGSQDEVVDCSLRDVIGIDIHREEQDLRDGLEFVTKKLKSIQD